MNKTIKKIDLMTGPKLGGGGGVSGGSAKSPNFTLFFLKPSLSVPTIPSFSIGMIPITIMVSVSVCQFPYQYGKQPGISISIGIRSSIGMVLILIPILGRLWVIYLVLVLVPYQ